MTADSEDPAVGDEELDPDALDDTDDPAQISELTIAVLYGKDAVPIRIKIMLDRLLNQLPDEQSDAMLMSAGWRREDFDRGFIDEVRSVCPSPIGDAYCDLDGLSRASDYGRVVSRDRVHNLP